MEEPYAENTTDPTSLDAATPAPPIAVGDMNRFALKHCLSAKSFSSVYAAFDTRLSREVVVKVLKTARADATRSCQASQAADLLAGARLAARLAHPFIVTVHDAGLCDQDVYVAMEHLEGEDLCSRLASGWRPAPRDAVRIASRIAAALIHANEGGIVHGRIEPANIFLTPLDQVKVLNFGIASCDADASPYAAPERLLGEPLDERSDVYGLGVLMYELLTGRPPFSGASTADLRHAVLLADVAEARARNATVPPRVSAVVARAMARDPSLRYASVRALLQALRQGSAGERARWALAWQDRRLQGAGAALALLALGTWAFVALRGGSPPPAVEAAKVAPPSTPATVTAASPASATSPPMQEPQPPSRVDANTAQAAERPLTAVAAAASTNAKRPPQRLPQRPPRVPTVSAKSATALPASEPQAAASLPASPASPATAPAAVVDTATAAVPAASAAVAPPPPGRGAILLAVEPWGQVEVNGAMIGTAPPMRRLTLPIGDYTITIRNGGFAPHSLNVTVSADKPVSISHRFGS
jgi:eukaryotic-like serine/threonine-protein kinase